MTVRYEILKEADGKRSVSAFLGGKLLIADQNHPNFQNILAGVVADEDESVLLGMFDITFVIGQRFDRLSDRLSASNGRIYFDGEEAHGALVDTILRFQQEGHDFLPLVNFFEKMQANPNPHSIVHAYRWLSTKNFTILPDGDVLAYKTVDDEWMSITAGRAIVDGVWVEGKIPNRVGSIIAMPRNEVEFDPAQGCSVGLHAATYSFARSFHVGGHMLALKINPVNIVSVPTESADAKMRVCSYEVMAEVDGPYESALVDLPSQRQHEDDEEELELSDYDHYIVTGVDRTLEDDDDGEDYVPPSFMEGANAAFNQVREVINRYRKGR